MVSVTMKLHGRHYRLRYQLNGRDVRVSTGTANRKVAEEKRKQLEARLLMGEVPRRRRKSDVEGPWMGWPEFVDIYKEKHLYALRPGSRADALSRLKICGQVSEAKTLGEMASRETLEELQRSLLESGRSKWTVKTTIDCLYTALRFAEDRDWIVKVPRISRVKTSKLRGMKGRPITTEEFERMLEATEGVVGAQARESWQYLLRGYWTSGLRRDELLSLSWDDDEWIRPDWSNRHPVLVIPAERQKNDTEEDIPMPPEFAALLKETPETGRTGWVFRPETLQTKYGRKPRHGRPKGEWVGKVVRKIARAAKVATHTAGGKLQFATVHDLRRSWAQRMIDADVDERIIQRIMRHESVETLRRFYARGRVQRDAQKLAEAVR
jgi:integrase